MTSVDIYDQIIATLETAHKPLLIKEIAERSGFNRHKVARNLDALEILGKVRKIQIGNAKKYYLVKSVPVSSLIDISSDLILIVDSQHIIQYINYSAQKFLNLQNRPIVGERLETLNLDIFSTADVQEGLRHFSPEKISRVEIEYHKEDRLFWYSLSIMAISIKSGSYSIALVAEDITQRKQFEIALSESETKYRSIFDAEADAIFLIDRDSGLIIDANSAACSTYGYEYREIVNLICTDLFYNPVEIHSILSPKSPDSSYIYHVKRDGTIFPVDISTSSFSIEDNHFVLAAIRNVSERKRMEDDLRESEEFVKSIFNSVSYEICILDETGVIISVNQRWRDFADQNPPIDESYYIGWNYLSVCEKATGESAENAKIFARGIRTVMRGELSTYCQEYECHSPDAMRYFVARVNRLILGPESPLRILITHEDITKRKLSELAHRDSEKRFREVLEHSSDVAYRRNVLTDSYDYLNPTITDITGYSAHEFASMPIDEIFGYVHPDDRETVKKALNISMGLKQGNFEFEYRFRHKLGHYVWFIDYFSIITDEKNNVYRVGRVRDITHKKFIEHELQKTQKHASFLAELLEQSSLPFAMSYPDGSMGYCNPAFLDLLGYTREELKTLNSFTDINQPEWKNIYENIAMSRPIYEEPFILEKMYSRKDGFLIPVEINLHVKRKPDGEVDFLYGFIKDITDRKKAEEEEKNRKHYLERLVKERTLHLEREIEARIQTELSLQENELRFRNLFDYAPNAIVVYDLDLDRFIDANPAAERLYACSREKLLSLNPKKFIMSFSPDPDTERSFFEYSDRVMNGEEVIFERKITDAEGIEKFCIVQLVKVPLPNRNLIRGSLIDISKRRELEEALSRSNAYNRSLIESSIDPLVTIGPEGHITDVNKATELATGYNRDELIGTDFCSYFTEPEKARKGYLEVFSMSEVRDYPLEIRHRDGTVTPVLYNASVFRDETGEVLGVFAAARDITQRIRDEEALRRSNAYNRSLIESSIDPLVTIGPEGHITDVNKATELATGYSRDELIGTDFCSYFTEPKKARAGYLEVFRESEVRDYPLEIRHRDGTITPVLYNASVFRDESREVLGVFAAARDISEQRKILENLHESEARFSSAFKDAPIGMALVSLDGRITKVNQTFSTMLGYSKEELQEMSYQEITHPEDLKADLENVTALFEGRNETYQMEKRYIHRDGNAIWAELSVSCVKDTDRNLSYFIAQIKDITKRKKAESEVEQYRRSLEKVITGRTYGLATGLTGDRKDEKNTHAPKFFEGISYRPNLKKTLDLVREDNYAEFKRFFDNMFKSDKDYSGLFAYMKNELKENQEDQIHAMIDFFLGDANESG